MQYHPGAKKSVLYVCYFDLSPLSREIFFKLKTHYRFCRFFRLNLFQIQIPPDFFCLLCFLWTITQETYSRSTVYTGYREVDVFCFPQQRTTLPAVASASAHGPLRRLEPLWLHGSGGRRHLCGAARGGLGWWNGGTNGTRTCTVWSSHWWGAGGM